MFDLKGHIRSNRAFYVYIFSSNNSLAHHLSPPLLSLTLAMPLYLFSLSCSSSHFLFFSSPPSHPYISLISTLCLSFFSLSLVLLLSFSFFHSSPHYPYIGLISTLWISIFSLSLVLLLLFLTLTYVLMDNFLSLFTLSLILSC